MVTEDNPGSRTLIVTIVNKGWGDIVVEASIKAGAEGGTILFGRGVGKDGALECAAAMDPSLLPADGLAAVSNQLLTNQDRGSLPTVSTRGANEPRFGSAWVKE